MILIQIQSDMPVLISNNRMSRCYEIPNKTASIVRLGVALCVWVHAAMIELDHDGM